MGNSIRVAVAGIGSCASSLVQLVTSVKGKNLKEDLNGIMQKKISHYGLNDIEFVCAFEVDEKKIGLDLSESIFTYPNASVKHINVPNTGIKVEAGQLLDGLDGQLGKIIKPPKQCSSIGIADISKRLLETKADVMVCYLPTGSYNAVRAYASAAIQAKVAFINATPEPVAKDVSFQEKFAKAGVPLLGDDLRSHLGATTLHTALIELLFSRGIKINNSYQLNVGGNMDFFNLSSPGRSNSKIKSKRNSLYAAGIDASRVTAGPSGYVEYLRDTKICYLRLEGSSIIDSNISIELRLQVEDSPNSAGVVVNAIRVAKTAIDNKIAGEVDSVCAFLFKSPKKGATESKALKGFNKFVIANKK